MTSDRRVTARAREVAGQAGLGAWECTLRVNARHDWTALINSSVTFFVAPWPFLGLGFFADQPRWSAAMCIVAGLLFLGIGVYFFRETCRAWRSGRALVHLFEDGAVLERTRGRILAVPYERATVDHVTWRESMGDGGERTRTHLWIAAPAGETVMIDAWQGKERADLALIAQRWGLPADPRRLRSTTQSHPVW